jgi:hypothetical protein
MLLVAGLVRIEDVNRNTALNPAMPISLTRFIDNPRLRIWTMSRSYRARERIQPRSEEPHEPPQPAFSLHLLPAGSATEVASRFRGPPDHPQEIVEHAVDLLTVGGREPAERLLMWRLPFRPFLRQFHLDQALGPSKVKLGRKDGLEAEAPSELFLNTPERPALIGSSPTPPVHRTGPHRGIVRDLRRHVGTAWRANSYLIKSAIFDHGRPGWAIWPISGS